MENLPVKSKKSIFEKIKNFLVAIFRFEKKEIEVKEEKLDSVQVLENHDSSNKKFNETIKAQVSGETIKNIQREDFLLKIEENPEILYSLPLEKLDILEEYYDELIAKEEAKMRKFKAANS